MNEQQLIGVSMGKGMIGILRTGGTKGGNEIVATVKIYDNADDIDNEELVDEVRLAYLRYYSRTATYKEKGAIL